MVTFNGIVPPRPTRPFQQAGADFSSRCRRVRDCLSHTCGPCCVAVTLENSRRRRRCSRISCPVARGRRGFSGDHFYPVCLCGPASVLCPELLGILRRKQCALYIFHLQIRCPAPGGGPTCQRGGMPRLSSETRPIPTIRGSSTDTRALKWCRDRRLDYQPWAGIGIVSCPIGGAARRSEVADI